MTFENMDVYESEENLLSVGDAKLHGEMYKNLSSIISKVLEIFPNIEAARPRTKSGIQALCSLHMALDKAKSLLSHCSESSKLYLAITGESVLQRFTKSKQSLLRSLRGVEPIVPEPITFQIIQIISQLENTEFSLDQSEKELGAAMVELLRRERNSDTNSAAEVETFHQMAIKLGITSSKAALTERRALRKLSERARAQQDWPKESIILHILHIMKKYSKLFRNEFSDDAESQSSGPCSPTVADTLGASRLFGEQLSGSNSPRVEKSMLPPEELHCPISLQLMYDPVIVSSGQTYERVCIEKWLNEGHRTCPKTQQRLSHLSLTPNYCVKGLIANWCEQNGVPIPRAPPDPLELTQWCEASVDPLTANFDFGKVNAHGLTPKYETDGVQRFEGLLLGLREGVDLREKLKVVEQIRLILRDDEEARIYMSGNGFVEELVKFLSLSVTEGDVFCQDAVAMALFNLAVNNDRNKGMILSAGVIPLLEDMIQGPSYEAAAALLLNLSYLEAAKRPIAASNAATWLVTLLTADHVSLQCKADSLHAIYNLSSNPSNILKLLSAAIIPPLHALLSEPMPAVVGAANMAEKSLAILANLSTNLEGKKEIMAVPGLIGNLAAALETGDEAEQEKAAVCLFNLCEGDERCSHLVLQEGVIPALVSLSVTGTVQAREKAQRLLTSFREQRQREQSGGESSASAANATPPGAAEGKALCKSKSRKFGRTLSCMWKSKSFSMYQC